jgi:hypothetical protein
VLVLGLVQGSDDANDDDQHASVRPPFPSFLPFFPSLPSTMPGTLLNHPLIQKNPKVANRQRVDVSEPKTKMAKTGLTRTFTPVEAVKQLHQWTVSSIPSSPSVISPLALMHRRFDSLGVLRTSGRCCSDTLGEMSQPSSIYRLVSLCKPSHGTPSPA